MNLKCIRRYALNVHTANLFLYIKLLCFSGLSVYLTFLVNIFLFLYVFLVLYRNKPSKFKSYLIISSIGNFLTFEVTVARYAELLHWEHILLIFFYIMTYYYCFLSTLTENDSNRTRPFFDFKSITYVKTKLLVESNNDLNYFKFVLFLLIASIYSTQLSFTTLCTPYMIFNF